MPEEPEDLSAADEALRTLREELAVAPSPGFEARVRSRVAGRRLAPRRWPWVVPATAAAVLLIGVVAWLLAPRAKGPAVAVESPAPPPVVTETPVARPTSVTPAPVMPSPVRTTRRAPVRPVAEPIRPLVEPGEEARIARYVASVRRRPLDAQTLAGSHPHRPLAEPAPIEVAPLDTAPLVPDEGSPR